METRPKLSSESKDSTEGSKNNAVEIDDSDEDEIEEEQLEEYQEMIEQLGSFPDKVTINSLSMVAEDHAGSRKNAQALYNCIREPLVSKSVASGRKLPLVYVVDSILKNVKGAFIPIIEMDAKTWMPIVFDDLSDDQRIKLKKVWNIWRDVGIFSETNWKEMGHVFEQADAKLSTEKLAANAKNRAAGIVRAPDGSLELPAALRSQMQILLDEAHSGVSELDKVSLERLADINPALLVEIKKAAEDMISGGQGSGIGAAEGNSQDFPASIFVETRTPEAIARSNDWEKLNWNHLDQTHDVVTKLQHFVITDSATNETYSQSDAIRMTSLLAASAATSALLTNALQRIKDQEESKENQSNSFNMLPPGQMNPAGNGHVATQFVPVDTKLFTNEGVKKKNSLVIGALYEVGLPFVSSSDGRRFATQIELSNHLDDLFRNSRLLESMEKTEERGWFVSGKAWCGEEGKTDTETSADAETPDAAEKEEMDPSTFTVPADESRDRCVVCGINFKMFFDNDDGIYKYSNCREIEVLNDDAAEKESESMLVHVTCWRGLGSPEVLTMDQALQERSY